MSDASIRNIESIYMSSEPAHGIVPLDYQLLLAIVTLIFGGLHGLMAINDKSNISQLFLIAEASLFLSFGAVFLVNGFRIYTGYPNTIKVQLLHIARNPMMNRSFVRSFISIAREQPFKLFEHNNEVSVAFSEQPNAIPIGWFPAESMEQFKPGFLFKPNPREEPEVLIEKPVKFRENPQFWPVASQILKKYIHTDAVFSDLVAAETRTPYFHIYDLRLPPLFGRIPEVEDILGTVELDINNDFTQIVPNSFQPNSMYRPVTQYGGMLVSPQMFEVLAKHLVS